MESVQLYWLYAVTNKSFILILVLIKYVTDNRFTNLNVSGIKLEHIFEINQYIF